MINVVIETVIEVVVEHIGALRIEARCDTRNERACRFIERLGFGFEGVAMRQITKEVGVTLPTVYHHFGSKEDLFKAVEADLYGTHAQSLLADLHEDADPEERLRNFINHLMDRFEENPDYFKLVQRNLIEPNKTNQKFLVKVSLQGLYDELKALLNSFKEGTGDDIGPVILFSTIIGFLTMRPAVQALKGYPYKKSKRKEERIRLVNITINAIKSM